jgi:hypothetical protein
VKYNCGSSYTITLPESLCTNLQISTETRVYGEIFVTKFKILLQQRVTRYVYFVHKARCCQGNDQIMRQQIPPTQEKRLLVTLSQRC